MAVCSTLAADNSYVHLPRIPSFLFLQPWLSRWDNCSHHEAALPFSNLLSFLHPSPATEAPAGGSWPPDFSLSLSFFSFFFFAHTVCLKGKTKKSLNQHLNIRSLHLEILLLKNQKILGPAFPCDTDPLSLRGGCPIPRGMCRPMP